MSAPRLRQPRTANRAVASLLMAAVALGLGSPGPVAAQSAPPSGEPPAIVVSTPILGAVVVDLVGDRATVRVLMPSGVDPHEWAPSARDLEAVHGADLVVVNGLGLEAGLEDTLAEIEAAGVPVFRATEHIDVLGLGDEPQVGGAAAAPGGDDHENGSLDPHFWVDPVAMSSVVQALGPAIGALGVDVGDRQADLIGRLAALDEEVRAILAAVPAESRILVTGHESMGYFAQRYDFRLAGAIIPGLSSQGETTARAMAELAQQVRALGVPVIFAELGTPTSVAEAIAAETGARVVELATEQLPEDGSYATFIRSLAQAIAEALG
jgi:zinc/manganese transport system substrate-binding protein